MHRIHRVVNASTLPAVLLCVLGAAVCAHAADDPAATAAPKAAAREVEKPVAPSPAAPAAAAPATSDAAAPAQGKVRGTASGAPLRYMTRDMEVIAKVLDLDAVQAPVIEAMLSDYIDAMTVSRPVLEYDRLTAEFQDNVKSVLSESQYERWPEVEAAIRRDRLAAGSTLPGESIDVIGLAMGMMGEGERASREMLAAMREYAESLDPLLRRRTDLLDSLRVSAGKGAPEGAARARMDEVAAVRIAIRDLNDRTLEYVASLMSAERGAMLRDRALRLSYPTAYGAGDAESMIRRAREEAAGAPEARDRVERLADALESRLAEARARAVQAVRQRSELASGARTAVGAEQVDERIKQSERELMQIDDWVIESLIADLPESMPLMADLREIVDGRDRFKRLKDRNGWGNAADTLAEFDADGDGVLGPDEAEFVFRTYTRNVSRLAKYRL